MTLNFSFGGAASNPQTKTPFSLNTTTTPAATSGFALGAATNMANMATPASSLTIFNKPANPSGTATVAPFGSSLGVGANSLLGGTVAPFGSSLGVGANSLLGGTAATPSTGLFGSTAATTTTSSLFGLTPASTAKPATTSLFGTTSATTGTGLAVFAAPSTKPATGFNLNTTSTQPLTLATTNLSSASAVNSVFPVTTNKNGNGRMSDSKAMKETDVPTEIAIIVDNFKKYVNEQKTIREEIARLTHKPILRVQEDVKQLHKSLALVSNGIQRNAAAIEKLKHESRLELKSIAIAQKTKDIPPTLQHENTEPIEYFQHLVVGFEQQMLLYKQEIETVEQLFVSLQQPHSLSPQELTMFLRKIDETFIALAAQLQIVHEAVKMQKESLLSYQKVFKGDVSDIFDQRHKVSEDIIPDLNRLSSLRVGPTPFSGVSNAAAQAMASALTRPHLLASAPPAIGLSTANSFMNPQTSQFGAGLGFGLNQPAFSNNQSTFGLQSAFDSPTQNSFGTASPFSLQKPPVGNKRGKSSK